MFNDTYKYYGKKGFIPIAPYENTSSKMRALELWQDKTTTHLLWERSTKMKRAKPFNERLRDIISQFPRDDEKYFKELVGRYS